MEPFSPAMKDRKPPSSLYIFPSSSVRSTGPRHFSVVWWVYQSLTPDNSGIVITISPFSNDMLDAGIRTCMVEIFDTPTDGSPCTVPTLSSPGQPCRKRWCDRTCGVLSQGGPDSLLIAWLFDLRFWMCILFQQKNTKVRVLDTPTMHVDGPFLGSYSDFRTHFGSIRIFAGQGMPWLPWKHLEFRSHHAKQHLKHIAVGTLEVTSVHDPKRFKNL